MNPKRVSDLCCAKHSCFVYLRNSYITFHLMDYKTLIFTFLLLISSLKNRKIQSLWLNISFIDHIQYVNSFSFIQFKKIKYKKFLRLIWCRFQKTNHFPRDSSSFQCLLCNDLKKFQCFQTIAHQNIYTQAVLPFQ